jgi:hypothetical protein
VVVLERKKKGRKRRKEREERRSASQSLFLDAVDKLTVLRLYLSSVVVDRELETPNKSELYR